MLVAVRDSDAVSPWDVLARNALHDQKLRDWKHAGPEERAFDKLASVMQKVTGGPWGRQLGPAVSVKGLVCVVWRGESASG